MLLLLYAFVVEGKHLERIGSRHFESKMHARTEQVTGASRETAICC